MSSLAVPANLLAQGQGAPKYEDAEAKRIVESMVQAHGGADAWFSAPTLQFTAAMYLASLPVTEGRTYFDNWRNYTVTVQPQTSRGWVELPFESE